jgi:hypothetical protein
LWTKTDVTQRILSSLAALAIAWLIAGPADLQAQRGGRGGPPPAPREAAAIDLTGYWVSVITEDWKLRMVTPKKGAFDALPLNAEGRRVGGLWDPAKDTAAGEQCKAYGAGGLMRLPGRLHITWQDASTLKIEADAGTQTRVIRFGAAPAPSGEPSWQGQSMAEWTYGPPARRGGGGGESRSGSLKVVTNNLRPGYVRKNGVPYSKDAVVTEYYDVNVLPNGETWFTVTTRLDDPTYFARPYITTTDFKKLPDATGWNPTQCSAT